MELQNLKQTMFFLKKGHFITDIIMILWLPEIPRSPAGPSDKRFEG